jgi:hypothetical protein
MTKAELCALLKKTVCRVLIRDGEVTSAGSGVVVSGSGTVVTAQHVIAANGKQKHGTLTVNIHGAEPTEYVIGSMVWPGIDIGQPSLLRPLPIDLAILKPTRHLNMPDYLRLRDDIPAEGTDVMLGGFPDDILLPFMFNEAFEVMNPDMNTMSTEIERFYKHVIRPMLCIDTMLGSVVPINATLNGKAFSAATYTTPIGFTYGGSGGAVVDTDGRLVGITIRKGITEARMLRIHADGGTLQRLPTTTGYALSHRLITELPGICEI